MKLGSLHIIGVIVGLLLVTGRGAAQLPAQPGQADQQAPPQPLRPLAVTQLDERQPTNDLDSTRPISLSLATSSPAARGLARLQRLRRWHRTQASA